MLKITSLYLDLHNLITLSNILI